MTIEMNDFDEKVWGYLITHKTPVRPGTLAKLWIVSESRVRGVLTRFVKAGIVDVVRLGSVKYYKVKE